MINKTLLTFLLAIGLSFSFNSKSAEVEIKIELPVIDVTDYQKPYVAIWVESGEGNKAIFVWHLSKRKQDKWLMDIRRWWRKVGRDLIDMPDGVSGATRGPGKYSKTWNSGKLTDFTIFVEVVREDGGRTIKKQKISITNQPQTFHLKAQGELGDVSISVGAKL